MISLLPQDLINKIAAGEVVERPASVVKELTENAVDAGATRIGITLEEGGTRLIQITDNGVGMNEEDAKLCLVRHATSKISSAEDLFRIATLGFRGEALASIASVSQFELVTKTANDVSGYSVTLGSDDISLVPRAANQGTQVTVRNLFYNVPARQKFLKKAQTEYTHILRSLQQFAMVHPDLELSLVHNGKTIFHYQAQDWIERVKAVLGNEMGSRLIPVEFNQPGLSISGLVAKPELVHATHANQYLFVNERPVYDHLISRSVLEAYETLIPRGYFPAFVIRIQLNPADVDVNVHPRKSEVKFLDPFRVGSAVKQAVRESLQAHDLTSEPNLSQAPVGSRFPNVGAGKGRYQPSQTSQFMQFQARKPSTSEVKQALEFSEQMIGSIRTLKKEPLEEQQWRIIGQVHRSFILVETPEGLQLMDQHALSEIVNYHRILTQVQSSSVSSQQLLLPIEVELNHEEKSLLDEHQPLLKKLGWEIDEISSTSVQVNSLPEILKVENIQKNLHEILDHLKEEKELDLHAKELQLIKYEACRSAVMFGDELTTAEMTALLNQWLETPNNAACEHGRPAAARLTVQEMRRFFKR